MSVASTKKLGKNTAFLYLRMIVVLSVSLFTTRIILKNLGIVDYGIYNVVGSIVSLFYFLQTAISSANYRFMAVAIGKNDVKGLSSSVQSAFIISAFVIIVIFLLGETLGLFYIYNYLNVPANRFSASVFVFHVSLVSCAVQCITMVYYSLIIAQENMNFFAILSIFECLLKILIAFGVGYTPIDKLEFYALLILLSNIIVMSIYHIYNMRILKTIAFKITQKVDRSLLKQMMSFSGWTLFVTIADISVTSGLNMIINVFFTPVINAARGIVVQIQGAIDQFRGNLQTALNPQITKQYAKGDLQRMYVLMSASGRFSTYILSLITIPICFLGNDILKLWLHDVPPYTSVFLIYVLISCIIDGISNPFVTAMGATGDVRKFQFYTGISKLLTLPFAYFALLWSSNPVVLFQIFLLMTIVTVIVRITVCVRQLNLTYTSIIKTMFLPCLMVAACCCFCSWGLHRLLQSTALLPIIVYVVATIIVNTIIIWFVGLMSNERMYCIQLIKNKLLK